MIPVLMLMIAATPQGHADASAKPASAKAAAERFVLNLPPDQDPPPEVHLNAPDAAAETATDTALAPGADTLKAVSDEASPSSSAPAPADDASAPAAVAATPAVHALPDTDDPSRVDASPIADTEIPASAVAAPAPDAVASADGAAQPASDASAAPATGDEPQSASATPDAAPKSDTPDTPSPDASAENAHDDAAATPADARADATPPTDGTGASDPAPPADTPDAAPAQDASPGGGDAANTADAEPLHTAFTLDTPIADLIADPRGKAVLDKDLPGLSDDPNLAKFSALSLRKFQPLTGGQLTDKLLQKVANDLVLAASGNAPSSPDDLTPTTMPEPKAKPGRDRFSDGR